MFPAVEAQPNFSQQEEEILAFWQKNSIYQKSEAINKGKPPYVVFDGPPTANALPPLHTVVPMSFKDLVGRYKTMRGYYVRRQAGWDTHGLPVEVQVEKAKGLSSKKDILNLVPGDEAASIREFNKTCKQSVWEFKQEWDKFVPRVGYWVNTDEPYITYDARYVENVWGVFKQIWDKGLVFKGHKVVPYCPRCGTALSAGEVAQGYQDVHDTSVFIAFPLVDTPNRSILAWTTTPWTLPGNVALAVGKNIEYAVIRQETREYIIAKARLSVVKGEYEIIETLKGSQLIGLKYQPAFPGVFSDCANTDLHTVVSADFVTTEDGTGVVHTAVMYGEDDYQLADRYDLPRVHTVDLDGSFNPRVKGFEGVYIRDAEKELLETLKSTGFLYAKQSITHSYPFCWRCKTALIYYAKDSWFISMSTQRAELIQANAEVQWIPDHIKEGRFGDFIREARDWAISRERFWGTPMPVWLSPSGKALCIGSYAELKQYAKDPSAIGPEFDPHRPFVDEIILVKDGEEYVREPLVLDVWFDSGAMPFASGRFANHEYPADYIAEAIDQTRGWFYSLMAISTLITGKSSYKRVVCMGHLVDEHGKKMSKSVGNVFNPWETFQVCGVDAIRWFLYSVNSPGESKAFSIKELQTRFRKSILLLWNVFNYFVTYANLHQFEAPSPQERTAFLQRTDLPYLDRWVLSRLEQTQDKVTKYMEAYDFMRASREIESFISELSTWYVRRSRGRSDSEFYTTLYCVLHRLALLMAPFTPFISERIFGVLRHADEAESVHLMPWPEPGRTVEKAVVEDMNSIRTVVEYGLAIRAQAGLKVRQPLSDIAVLIRDERVKARLAKNAELCEIALEELNIIRQEATSSILVTELPAPWPAKDDGTIAVAINPELSESLVLLGQARELLRQVQQLRKTSGLQPGQMARLGVEELQIGLVSRLTEADSTLIEKAFIEIQSGLQGTESFELTLDGQEITVTLTPLNG
jgi:isoleucyl-tRNA synthetase